MLELNEMLTLLSNYSIINLDTSTRLKYENQIVRIHSLTQCFMETNHTPQDVSQQLEKIASIFIKDLKGCLSNKELQDGKYWLNHFYKIYGDKDKKPLFLEYLLHNLDLISSLFNTKGIPYKALEVFEYISHHQKEKHGEDHPIYLRTTIHLADCPRENGQSAKALDLMENSCGKSLSINGTLHPLHCDLKDRLGKCLCKMNRLDEAFQIYQEVEQAKFKVLGPAHPSYLHTKKYLTKCMRKKENKEDEKKI